MKKSLKFHRPILTYADEAYHTFAPTYQETIRFIQKCRKDTNLLELTATPVRANDEDSKSLLKLYDNKIVYSVPYHEMLHRDFPYHDKKFREMEHRYPQYEEWDHFLDDNMEKFEKREW